MLLIRGLSNPKYALPINKGIISCRDLPSILCEDVNTGYALSNYHEPLLANSRLDWHSSISPDWALTPRGKLIANIFCDPFIHGTYLSYFHTVSPETEKWLDEQWANSDGYFIYLVPHFLSSGSYKTESIAGFGKTNYFGGKLQYYSKTEEISIRQSILDNLQGALSLYDSETFGCSNLVLKECYLAEFIEMACACFSRVINGKFDSSENEYRLLARTPRYLKGNTVEYDSDNPIAIPNISYKEEEFSTSIKVIGSDQKLRKIIIDIQMTSKSTGRELYLSNILQDDKNIRLISNFKNISIKDSADRYGYIGNIEATRSFIRRYLSEGTDWINIDENNHTYSGKRSVKLRIEKLDSQTEKQFTHVLVPPDKGRFK